jgi:BarA-like signal transduction histidine kinase
MTRDKFLKLVYMYTVTQLSSTHFQVHLLVISFTFRAPLNILKVLDYKANLFRIVTQMFVLVLTVS